MQNNLLQNSNRKLQITKKNSIRKQIDTIEDIAIQIRTEQNRLLELIADKDLQAREKKEYLRYTEQKLLKQDIEVDLEKQLIDLNRLIVEQLQIVLNQFQIRADLKNI